LTGWPPSQEGLAVGLWQWIVAHLTHADFTPSNEEQLVAAMRESFTGFDADASLIQAMLHSPQGLAVRRRQQPGRRAMFEACVEDAVPGAPPDVRAAAAAALQVLYSAPSWETLRNFWDMDAAESAGVIELAIHCLLAGLRSSVPGHSTTDHAADSRQGREP
jgi:hypothetical protein